MSDSPQLPPSTDTHQGVPVKSVTTEHITVPSDITAPITTTSITKTYGFNDVIPTLLPALQSSSYVLVILFSFLAWSSRKLVTNFLDKHLELMTTVKDGLAAQQIVSEKHADIMAAMTVNNGVLAHTLNTAASTRNIEAVHNNPEQL